VIVVYVSSEPFEWRPRTSHLQPAIKPHETCGLEERSPFSKIWGLGRPGTGHSNAHQGINTVSQPLNESSELHCLVLSDFETILATDGNSHKVTGAPLKLDQPSRLGLGMHVDGSQRLLPSCRE